MVMMMVAGQSP